MSLPPPDPQTPRCDAFVMAQEDVDSFKQSYKETAELARTLERELILASAKLEKMEKALKETRAEIAIEKDVLELAQQKPWRHFREDMEAMQCRMVTQLHNIDAALASSLNTEKKT